MRHVWERIRLTRNSENGVVFMLAIASLGQLRLGRLPAGFFLASVDPTRARLILHARAGSNEREARSQVLSAVAQAGVDLDVNIQLHRVRKLAFPRSIEHWLANIEVGTIIYDPTLIARRARALLSAATACRAEFGKLVGGIYFDPKQRTLIVAISAAVGPQLVGEFHQRAMRVITAVWDAPGAGASAVSDSAMPFAVRVMHEANDRNLVPVDAASATISWRIRNVLRSGLLPSTVGLAVAAFAVPAFAARTDIQHDRTVPAHIGGSPSANLLADYGVLAGLSVFTEGQAPSRLDGFGISGMRGYFGDNHSPNGQNMQTPRRFFALNFGSVRKNSVLGQVQGQANDEGQGPGS
jgi:hypothetical protein